MRNYKGETPSTEWLEKIIQIAGYAPGSPHHRVGWVRNITVVLGAQPMKEVLELTAEYVQRTLRLLTGWPIKMASKFSDSAKAGLAVVPDLEMRLDEYRKGRDVLTHGAPPQSSSMPPSPRQRLKRIVTPRC